MIIDLKQIPILWINLEEHETNRQDIVQMLNSHGLVNNHRTPGIRVTGYNREAYHQRVDHYMGVGLAQMNAMRTAKQNLPCLVLEDDVKISDSFQSILNVPDDTDAVYLGVSHAGNPYGIKINDNYARVFNVLAAHAIVYVSPRFADAAFNAAKNCLIDHMAPFDLGMAQLLANYNVIAPVTPYFYQSNDRQSANKWEDLTKNPIKMYDKRN